MYTTTIQVRWGELDPYGHVNHAAYLSYLEHARIGALEGIGWGMDKLRGRGCQVVVVRADVRFRRPATAGDTLTITTGIIDLRPATSRWRQQMWRDDDLIVEAEITAAFTTAEGQPARPPRELQEALRALLWEEP
jgi:acyl-CoA thioester hydrolase